VNLTEVRDRFEQVKVGWFIGSRKSQELDLRELLRLEHALQTINDTNDPLLRLEIRDLKLQLAERLGI